MSIAEGVRSVVTAPQLGLLQEVNVRPYQWVAEIRPGETVSVLFMKPVRTRRAAPEPPDAQASRE